MLARLIGENIRIVTKLSAGLRSIRVDPSQIEQVILNLVVNAKDAMPKGGKVTLETSNVYLDEAFTSTHLSVSRGHYVLLSVSDEGVGMGADTVSRIFEPFFTTKPIGKGTGLGLTTTYGIVKQSKGTIWVYSELGKGTVFKVYLPVAEGVVAEPEAGPVSVAEVVGMQTILLVEDDDRLRAGFTEMLRRKGYVVLAAANGEEALKLLSGDSQPVHLLLTDVVMPGLNGFELARAVLGARPAVRVLYMSGYTHDALENPAFKEEEESGSLEFIQKPFDTRSLVAKVQEVLAKPAPKISRVTIPARRRCRVSLAAARSRFRCFRF